MDELRDNQIKAINKFKKYYIDDKNTKGILSMCCGSGKSRVFYEIIKMNIDNNFFIYVTSRISLVHDMTRNLLKWISLDKIKDIQLLTKVSDINIKSLYGAEKEFLIKYNKDNNNGIKNLSSTLDKEKDIIDKLYNKKKIIIITTYNSINKIYEIIHTLNKFNPDLLVCDEAHNLATTAKNDSIYNSISEIPVAKLITNDTYNNLPIYCVPSRILYMTATPLKVITMNKSLNYENEDISFSMDNKARFGEIFYEYTFYEGIRDEYILDFKIIHLDDLDKVNLEYDKKILEYDENKQQYIYFCAISEILLKCILEYKLKRIIVYLSNQNKVKDLKEILDKKIESENKYNNINTYKLISGDKKKDKEKDKKEFENIQELNNVKILLSVAILNEGIDIPICDSVFFAEERKSESNIIQNIGRALRVYNKNGYVKENAYVIIPTKIYNCGKSNLSTYSSKFKKIRDICHIMKQKNSNSFVNRITTNINSLSNRNDIDEIDELSNLIDKVETNYVINNEHETLNTLIQNKDELETESQYLVNTFNIVCSNSDNLHNISYIDFKKSIQESEPKINRLQDINKFYKDNRIPYECPHIHFKKEWICYGDLLKNEIYSYEKAKETIKNFNLKDINTSSEWTIFYNKIIKEALDNRENIDIELLDKILYIPQDPKNYYIDIWNENSWSDFLGVNIEKNIFINKEFKNSSSSTNAVTNISNLINNDRDKIIKLCYGDSWNLYNKINLKTNLSILKRYIDEEFNIDSNMDIIYSTHNNGNYNTFIIEIILPYQTNKESPIIINRYNKVCYDKNYNLNIYNSDGYKCNKSISRYLQDEECRNIICSIDKELKNYVNNI